jgi:GAF domain-containing protein
LHAAALAVLLVAAFWRQAGHRVQGGALLVVTYWLAFVALYRNGYAAEAQVLLVSAVVLTVLLFGRRAGLASLLANALLMTVMGWLWIGGAAGSDGRGRMSGDVWRQAWIGKTLVLTVLGGALTFAVGHLVAGLEATLAEMKLHARQLEARDDILARETEGPAQRNALLSRRSEALRTAVSVALDLALTLEEDALLDRAAALTSERFGFFHVGIFLLDPDGDWAELRAASSEGGKRMLARQHRLRVGEEGIIGFVMGHGEPRVASHVDADPVYYENPDLPETRSEIAVPMRYQDRIIGALDIQETSPDAFRSEDTVAMQELADLITAAVRNARLFGQLQESVAAERRSYAELSAQAWLERARAMEGVGYRYEQGRVARLAGPGTDREVRSGDVGSARAEQTWPLSVRGRFVGLVEAHKTADQGNWTDAELELMETVIEQLGAALESARLYEDTQSRAARDRLLADMAARIRETLDLDTVLKTAADEIYAALDLEEVVIHLAPLNQGEGSQGER